MLPFTTSSASSSQAHRASGASGDVVTRLETGGSGEHSTARNARRLAWYFVLLGGLVGVIISGVLAASWLHQNHPDVARDLVIKLDIFALTDVGAAERQRQAQIRALNIPYEKKDVLLNRTVFLGADKHMVQLALGNPRSVERKRAKNAARFNDVWVYYFHGENRPTLLEFENESLISAYKGSVLDLAK